MKPIHKFNNGNGATLCHLCRTIITVGKPTNDLYCDRCLRERNCVELEFLKSKVRANRLNPSIVIQKAINKADDDLQSKHDC